MSVHQLCRSFDINIIIKMYEVNFPSRIQSCIIFVIIDTILQAPCLI